MSKVNVVIGAIAGLAVGALLGVLFAPERGEDTRKKLSKTSKETTDVIKDKFNELIDDLASHFEKVKEDIIAEKEEVEA